VRGRGGVRGECCAGVCAQVFVGFLLALLSSKLLEED